MLSLINYWGSHRSGEAFRLLTHENQPGGDLCTGQASALSWKDLDRLSDRLAAAVRKSLPGNRDPLVVVGHKHPLMLVCFLACFKAGHAYCPVDSSMPRQRITDIIATVDRPLVLCPDQLMDTLAAGDPGRSYWGFAQLEEILFKQPEVATPDGAGTFAPVRGDETHYIIFTSGSSGTPKGVQVSHNNLLSFIEWVQQLVFSADQCAGLAALLRADCPGSEQDAPAVAADRADLLGDRLPVLNFLNQAPFSFDLSVMDLYLALSTGGCLWSLTADTIASPPALYPALKGSPLNVWVSTPSFAEVCLADSEFSEKSLEGLNTFLFCGETLANRTYDRLQSRFPSARIYNTYGPTETTVAVTDILVTPAISAAEKPLPVGRPKPDTDIYIVKDGTALPEGERGEIVIAGRSVTKGYFKQPDLTDKAFIKVNFSGCAQPAYRTGDEGYLKDGKLYYVGRLDFQVKLHGYRIELGDIENNLMKCQGVERAAVVPLYRRGAVSSLKAFVQFKQDAAAGDTADPAEQTAGADRRAEADLLARLKAELATFVPAYMVPQKMQLVDRLPMTANGKIDRKALGDL